MRKLLFIIPLLILLVACGTTTKVIEIPVETVKTEYIYNGKVDSITIRDSVDRWINGDTVTIYKEHTEYKYLLRTDTIVRTDSIPKIVTVETVKEVEVNHIYWYQKTLMWLGGILSLLLLVLTVIKLKIKLWK